MKPVEIAWRAERDFLEITRYIGRDGLEVAERFGDRIDSILDALAENPKLGRVRNDLGRHLRSIPEGNYLIFYRERADRITILRILHGRRDLHRIWRVKG
jgi:plasmid stabilization system protein ParE